MSRIARACLLVLTLLPPPLTLAASTAYSFECNPASGIKPDPNEHKRVGYITAFQGLGLPSLRADIKVASPYLGLPAYGGKSLSTGNTAEVVGVIEKFEWSGGQGDAIQLDFYVSQQNAVQIKTAMQKALTSAKVDQLGWWIADYDQSAKKWYEQAYPASSRTITAIIAGKNNPDLNVNLTPVAVKNVTLYKVSMKVAPAANMQYRMFLANSSTTSVAKPWGLIVGKGPGAL
jgi:hypothetical protein